MLNSVVNPFGVSVWSQTTYGWGPVGTPHAINQGVTRLYIPRNAVVSAPSSAVTVFRDPYNTLGCIVMEQTVQTGNGRVLVFGDWDAFTDVFMPNYPENRTVAQNVAEWALRRSTMSGTVQLSNYMGSPVGKRVTLSLFREGRLVKHVQGTLGPGGSYSVSVLRSGTYDIVAKPQGYLSVRTYGVQLQYGNNAINWHATRCGDANEDNTIDTRDLSAVLVHFSAPTPHPYDLDGDGEVGLSDVSAILVNFGQSGA